MKNKRIKGLGLLSIIIVSLGCFLFECFKETHTVGNTIFAMVCLVVFGRCIIDYGKQE